MCSKYFVFVGCTVMVQRISVLLSTYVITLVFLCFLFYLTFFLFQIMLIQIYVSEIKIQQDCYHSDSQPDAFHDV